MAVLETLSVQEAATFLGVHRDTLYKAIKHDEIDGIDCSGKTRLLKRDVEAFTVRTAGRPKKENVANETRSA